MSSTTTTAPSRPAGSAIVADSLVKHFGDVHALDGVSFEVPTGTVLGLLGPNGAGKTTAVRILTTILQPTSGRAVVAGIDVADHPHEVRRRIGLAGQYAAVDENLTGYENLRLVGRLNHLARSAPAPAARSCSPSSACPTQPTGRCARTQAACGAGSTSPPRS